MKSPISQLVRQRLAVAPAETWNDNEKLLILDALTKIVQGRAAAPERGGENVIPFKLVRT